MTPHRDHLDWSKSFMYSLHETYFLVEKRLEQKLAEVEGITFSQFLIMLPLNCERAGSQNDIAEFLHLTEATVSRHISGLTESGYLLRKEDQTNRRKHILSLTAKGTKAFMRAHTLIESELKEIFGDVPEKDRQYITRAFDTVLNKLIN